MEGLQKFMKKSVEPNSIIKNIKEIREQTILKRRRFTSDQLNKPVSFWIKDDRLLNEKGKEFTIILRTKGCSWALSDSGGCSMCGYIKDSSIENIDDKHIINQVNHAFQSKLEEIRNERKNFIFKVFNSGSFFDENEISEEVRNYIYQKVYESDNIEEFVIESRLEYISKMKLIDLKNQLNNKYIELAIGLETVNDYIRNNYINKAMFYDDFLKVFRICKEIGIGVRVYLLFKPPFLNEQGAIDDCVKSIINLVNLGVDTISINPINIQKGTLIEYLWYQNRYRPPWFYSLFKSLRKIHESNKETIFPRLISDPSGAGTKRGIHNCLKRECNQKMVNILRNFVLSQDFNYINKKNVYYDCDCLTRYRLQKNFH